MTLSLTQQEQIAKLASALPQMHPDVLDILHRRFTQAKKDQERKGVTFTLKFDEFLKLTGAGRRNTLLKHHIAGTLKQFLKSNSGYCLTWKNKAAYQSQHMNAETAAFTTRKMSRRVNQFVAGDKHTEKSKAMISAKKTGVPQSEKTKAKRSASLMGHDVSDEARAKMSAKKQGTTKSPEERARISASMKATLAAKKAAKAVQP